LGALSGLKVLELGQVVAAPFCGALLADFGAEVIKVEPLEGDGIRQMGPVVDGRSLWYAVENRNKKTISLDLKTAGGKEILDKLIKEADVMTENFRPGVLSKLGFPWERINSLNPRLILARMSGYGQTGPYRNRAGYDRIGVGMGGLTYLTGFKDREPLKPGVSIADYLAGFSAALGILIAIYERDAKGGGQGQEIDIGLYEPIFRILEFTALNYHLTAAVRERTGNLFMATVPGGHFKTKDGKWVSLAVGNDKLFTVLMTLIDRKDMLERPEYKTQVKRQANREEIDELMRKWVEGHTAQECFDLLGDHIPIGPIHDIAGIFEDPHYAARGNIAEVADALWGKVKMQGVMPRLSRTPGEVRWIGPDLGQDTWEILEKLNYTDKSIDALEKQGAVKGRTPFREYLAGLRQKQMGGV
jgi:formyl-CoA transferase/succinyl-CoA--D-citramalate CoA-transferase